MKVQMIKSAGGAFVPLDDEQAEALKKFRNGEQYEIEIKLSRNPQFHRKDFAFFKFCFDHWSADKTEWQFQDEQAEFERCYNSLINAAMKHIFKGCNDPQILDRLYAFFY